MEGKMKKSLIRVGWVSFRRQKKLRFQEPFHILERGNPVERGNQFLKGGTKKWLHTMPIHCYEEAMTTTCADNLNKNIKIVMLNEK